MSLKTKLSVCPMNKIINIYCEGTKGSHDYDILEKIIVDLSCTVKIEPIGGKRGAVNVINALEQVATDKADYYFFFRDRDFDQDLRKVEKACLFREPKKKPNGEVVGQVCFSYRTTIENYLFDIQTFYKYLTEKNLLVKHNINSVEDVKRKFITAAKNIKYYQAVRHALGEIREPVDFGTTWGNRSSGKLPDELDEISCRTNGWKCISASKQIINEKWTEECFKEKVNAFLEIFNDEFFDNLSFLIWFQGKDFGASLISKEFQGIGLDNYYKFSKNHFDYKEFSDLLEFRNLLKGTFQQ